MTCKQVDSYLDDQWRDGGAVMPLEVARHLRECSRCFRLYQFCASAPVAVAVHPGVLHSVRERLIPMLEPVSQAPGHWMQAFRLMAIAAIVALGALLIVVGTEVPIAYRPGSVTVLLGAVLVTANSLGRLTTPGTYRAVTPATVVAIVLGSLTVAVAAVFPWGGDTGVHLGGGACLAEGLLVAIPAAVAFAFLARRGAIFSAVAVYATIGLLAGLTGHLTVTLSCPIGDAEHRLVWHVAIPVVTAMTGVLVGRMFATRQT